MPVFNPFFKSEALLPELAATALLPPLLLDDLHVHGKVVSNLSPRSTFDDIYRRLKAPCEKKFKGSHWAKIFSDFVEAVDATFQVEPFLQAPLVDKDKIYNPKIPQMQDNDVTKIRSKLAEKFPESIEILNDCLKLLHKIAQLRSTCYLGLVALLDEINDFILAQNDQCNPESVALLKTRTSRMLNVKSSTRVQKPQAATVAGAGAARSRLQTSTTQITDNPSQLVGMSGHEQAAIMQSLQAMQHDTEILRQFETAYEQGYEKIQTMLSKPASSLAWLNEFCKKFPNTTFELNFNFELSVTSGRVADAHQLMILNNAKEWLQRNVGIDNLHPARKNQFRKLVISEFSVIKGGAYAKLIAKFLKLGLDGDTVGLIRSMCSSKVEHFLSQLQQIQQYRPQTFTDVKIKQQYEETRHEVQRANNEFGEHHVGNFLKIKASYYLTIKAFSTFLFAYLRSIRDSLKLILEKPSLAAVIDDMLEDDKPAFFRYNNFAKREWLHDWLKPLYASKTIITYSSEPQKKLPASLEIIQKEVAQLAKTLEPILALAEKLDDLQKQQKRDAEKPLKKQIEGFLGIIAGIKHAYLKVILKMDVGSLKHLKKNALTDNVAETIQVIRYNQGINAELQHLKQTVQSNKSKLADSLCEELVDFCAEADDSGTEHAEQILHYFVMLSKLYDSAFALKVDTEQDSTAKKRMQQQALQEINDFSQACLSPAAAAGPR